MGHWMYGLYGIVTVRQSEETWNRCGTGMEVTLGMQLLHRGWLELIDISHAEMMNMMWVMHRVFPANIF